jgi:GDP-L-fucose synthase
VTSQTRGGRRPMASIPFELKGKTVYVACHRGIIGSAGVQTHEAERVETAQRS